MIGSLDCSGRKSNSRLNSHVSPGAAYTKVLFPVGKFVTFTDYKSIGIIICQTFRNIHLIFQIQYMHAIIKKFVNIFQLFVQKQKIKIQNMKMMFW